MLTREFKKGNMTVKVYDSRISMGKEAAAEAAVYLKEAIAAKGEINVIFAAAPSQNEFLEALTKEEGIDWQKVHAFHMDEYVGLPADAPQGFGNFLDRVTLEKIALSRKLPKP